MLVWGGCRELLSSNIHPRQHSDLAAMKRRRLLRSLLHRREVAFRAFAHWESVAATSLFRDAAATPRRSLRDARATVTLYTPSQATYTLYPPPLNAAPMLRRRRGALSATL